MNIPPELSEFRPSGATFAVSETGFGPRLYIRDASGTRVAFAPLDEAAVSYVVDCLSFPPKTLTEADLDTRSPGSFVIDDEGAVWVKYPSGRWAAEDGASFTAAEVARFFPRSHTPTTKENPK